MARPSGWDVLGLDADPTPGVVESVQALAKEFGDFAHDVKAAWTSLNSFGADTSALTWIGQSADTFKSNFGPLPGRLNKLWISYSEASDALAAYARKMQAAQDTADAALRQGLDAHADVSRATGSANNAADDLRSAQAGADPKALSDAQADHDAAQKRLNDAKERLAALAAQAQRAHDDLVAAAEECAKALHHASSDGIHNKHWWQHVGAVLSEVGGAVAEWAGEIGQIATVLAPVLNGLALLTVEVPGLDVVTASLAAADDLIAETAPEVAAAGMAMKATGDGLQGHFKDAFMAGAMFAASRMGGKGGGDGPEPGSEEPDLGPLGTKNSPVSRLTDDGNGGGPVGTPDDELWEVPQAAKDKVPDYLGQGGPNKKHPGWRWPGPDVKDKGDGIRIDKGNPNHELPTQQVDHVIIRSKGKVLGRDGKPISGSIMDDPVNAHIPLEDWLQWEEWNKP